MSELSLEGLSMQHLYKCCGGYHTGVINKKDNFVLFCGTVKVRKVINASCVSGFSVVSTYIC